MVKIKAWELHFEVSSFNPSFSFLVFLFCFNLVSLHCLCLCTSIQVSFTVLFKFYACQVIRIFILKFCSIFVFLGFLGKRLCTHNLAYACRLVLVCASHSLETLILFDCCFYFHMFCFVQFLSICFMLHKFLFALFTCLLVYHMLEFGFILCLLYFNAMIMHSYVHALMSQVLSCYKVNKG